MLSKLNGNSTNTINRLSKNLLFTAQYEQIMLAFAIKMGADLSHYSRLKIYSSHLETCLLGFTEIMQQYSNIINDFKNSDNLKEVPSRRQNIIRTVNRKQTKAELQTIKEHNENKLQKRLVRKSNFANLDSPEESNLRSNPTIKKLKTIKYYQELFENNQALAQESNFSGLKSVKFEISNKPNLEKIYSNITRKNEEMKLSLELFKEEYIDFIQNGAKKLIEVNKSNAFGIVKLMNVN